MDNANIICAQDKKLQTFKNTSKHILQIHEKATRYEPISKKILNTIEISIFYYKFNDVLALLPLLNIFR